MVPFDMFRRKWWLQGLEIGRGLQHDFCHEGSRGVKSDLMIRISPCPQRPHYEKKTVLHKCRM